MSCSNSNAPIDISASNSSGKCDLKCDYKFKYGNSSCIGKNMGDYISLSYDNASSSSVTFNMISYNVTEVRLYHPSLHSFNGNKIDAEMIIVHKSNTGEIPFIVCIPIRLSNSTSISSVMFRNIIHTMSKKAPSQGDETTIQIKNYNLSSIIPKTKFYSYTATEPYQPCNETVNYVVFDATDSTLDINNDTYEIFKKIIQTNSYVTKSGVNYYLNEKGPNTATEDDIYIDCQPVGQSEETTDVVNDNSSGSNINDFSFDDLKNNDLFKFIAAILFFIIIIYIFSFLFGIIQKITKGNISQIFNKSSDT